MSHKQAFVMDRLGYVVAHAEREIGPSSASLSNFISFASFASFAVKNRCSDYGSPANPVLICWGGIPAISAITGDP